MSLTEKLQLDVTPELRQQLETDAAKLNLSVSAYVVYLYARRHPGRDAARLDRHVQQVFGKHGELMRRLAK